jgi:hypothetical protein
VSDYLYTSIHQIINQQSYALFPSTSRAFQTVFDGPANFCYLKLLQNEMISIQVPVNVHEQVSQGSICVYIYIYISKLNSKKEKYQYLPKREEVMQ